MVITERKHVEELFLFTDRLYSSETPSDVYEAAVDTITRALVWRGGVPRKRWAKSKGMGSTVGLRGT